MGFKRLLCGSRRLEQTFVKLLGVASFFLSVNQQDFRARSANAVYEATWVTSLYAIFAKSIFFAWRGKTKKIKSYVATLGYIHWMRFGLQTRERRTLRGRVTSLLQTENSFVPATLHERRKL